MSLLNQILGAARRSTATRGTRPTSTTRGATGTSRAGGGPAAAGLVGGLLRSLRGRRRL